MMANWQIGDQALCIDTSVYRHTNGWISTGEGLVLFKIYTVIGLESNHAAKVDLLMLADDPTGTMGRLEKRFIRIPPTEAETKIKRKIEEHV